MLLLRLVIGALSLSSVISFDFDFLPSIIKFSYQFSDKLGDPNKSKNLELSCDVSGEPKPEVEFHFNSVRLSSSARVRQIDTNTVKISNVNHTTDEGNYKCVARNKNGRVFKERFIRIQRLGHFLPPYTAKYKRIDRDVTLGRPLILPCPDHTPSHPVKYFWGRTGPPPSYLTEDKRINVLETGTLQISNLQQEDVNRFNGLGGISCVMVSGGQFVESVKMRFIVSSEVGLPTQSMVSPKLPSVTNIEDGASTSILCPATGNPAPDITWYKDGIKINTSNSDVDISQVSKLSITDFNKSLQGQYMCSLNNSEGSDNSTTSLRLVEPPTVVTTMSSYKCIKQNSKLLLNCEAKGTEPITYEWYHNGTRLESYSTINSGRTVSLLSIEPLHFNDTGIYHCFAYNNYGDDSDGTVIIVTESNMPNCACTNPAAPVSITTKCAYSSGVPLQAYYLIAAACQITLAVLLFHDIIV